MVGSTPRVNPPVSSMPDLLSKGSCPLALFLVLIVLCMQAPQALCLQTTSLRTCSLDVATSHLAEEVLQVQLSVQLYTTCQHFASLLFTMRNAAKVHNPMLSALFAFCHIPQVACHQQTLGHLKRDMTFASCCQSGSSMILLSHFSFIGK